MKLIIEPRDGVAPIVTAIKNAKQSVHIAIFRFDYKIIETALKAAVLRGVKVTALIASTNRGGVKHLRDLEMRLLAAGIVVARTDDDLIRYHDKFIIIDGRILYMLSFNFTRLDIDRSRGVGIVTKNSKLVQEAMKLFDADCTRTAYAPKTEEIVVSPANSRKVLAKFLRRAKKELLIFDPKISDKEMAAILQDRVKAGVEVRVIGRVSARHELAVKKPTAIRLHTRTIIRDRSQAFVGSQSLRTAELDLRRELGLILYDSNIVKSLVETFEDDWKACDGAKTAVAEPEVSEPEPANQDKVIEVLAQELQPIGQTLRKAVRKAVAEAGEEAVEEKLVKNTVKKLFKRAVKEAVREVAQDGSTIEQRA